MKCDVSIIIVNWNSKDYLRKCLESVYRQTSGITYEIVVVDGGSFDGCAEMLAKEFPQVVFVQSPDNVGFARANNLGARYANGESLLLLNPDTELTENSIAILYRNLHSFREAAAVGCRLVDGSNVLLTHSVQCYPTIVNRVFDSEFLRRKFPKSSMWDASALSFKKVSPVQGVSGACIMLTRECFERVQGFSERYFMYGEDIDLCFRISLEGYKIYHIPETTVIHYVGGSSNKAASDFATVMMSQSCYLFMRQHRGAVTAIAYRVAIGISALIRMLLIPPLLLFGGKFVAHGFDSVRKWRSVLYWSLGFARIRG